MTATKPNSCPCCGHWTEAGKRKLHEEHKAIYGTDLSKPVSEIVAGIRSALTQARGQIFDVSFRWPGWGERLKAVEGLLTCGIVTLYNDIEEMKKAEAPRDSAA